MDVIIFHCAHVRNSQRIKAVVGKILTQYNQQDLCFCAQNLCVQQYMLMLEQRLNGPFHKVHSESALP